MAKRKRKKSIKVESAGFLNPQIRPRKFRYYVVAELRHDSRIAYTPSGFAGPSDVEPTCHDLNRMLSRLKVKRIESHFGMRPSEIRKRSTEAPSSLVPQKTPKH
jgi:hypothetical protein